MAKNNLPVWCRENFSVRPELVEGWTEKFSSGAASPSCFDKLSTNGLSGDFAKLYLTESLIKIRRSDDAQRMGNFNSSRCTMQQYQHIREFLVTGCKLGLFEADLQPIDDLMLAYSRTPLGRFNENPACRGLEIMKEIIALLEKREHTRAVVRRIVRANGKFEDAALQLNATIKHVGNKLAELDSWLLSEHDRLVENNVDVFETDTWAIKPHKTAALAETLTDRTLQAG